MSPQRTSRCKSAEEGRLSAALYAARGRFCSVYGNNAALVVFEFCGAHILAPSPSAPICPASAYLARGFFCRLYLLPSRRFLNAIGMDSVLTSITCCPSRRPTKFPLRSYKLALRTMAILALFVVAKNLTV